MLLFLESVNNWKDKMMHRTTQFSFHIIKMLYKLLKFTWKEKYFQKLKYNILSPVHLRVTCKRICFTSLSEFFSINIYLRGTKLRFKEKKRDIDMLQNVKGKSISHFWNHICIYVISQVVMITRSSSF